MAENYSGRYQKVDENIYKNPEKVVQGGFYYDTQLEDPYLSISLHANTEFNGTEWVEWSGDKLEAVTPGVDWSTKYGKDPLARCIMSEDFAYSIANDWTDYNGGNPIEGLFNNFKPYAPILQKLGTGLGNGLKDMQKEDNFGSSIVKWIQGAVQNTGMVNILQNAGKLLNKALLVQGTRFTYYNGTQFNFNNMEMKFIAFSDYVKKGENSWEFQSVEDYIKTLQGYVMGTYEPCSTDFGTGREDVKNFISDYVGFQAPPGGFEMDTKNLDNVMKGTLRLNIGGTWAIENLVLKNMNVVMSKVQAKDPRTGNEGKTVPLYAEIVLQLYPASMIIDTGYKRILEHQGMSIIQTNISTGYKDKLDKIKKDITNKLNKK